MGCVDIAERIADAGAGMQIDEAGVAGRLRIAIGHADYAGLLQGEHVLDVVGPVAEERQFGRAGIAEHALDAEGAEQAEGGVLDGERGGGFSWLAGRHEVAPIRIFLYSALALERRRKQSTSRWIALRSQAGPRKATGLAYCARAGAASAHHLQRGRRPRRER